jgi:K+-transporting ATPase KdpF subunit
MFNVLILLTALVTLLLFVYLLVALLRPEWF